MTGSSTWAFGNLVRRLFGRLTRFDPPTVFMIAQRRKVHADADIPSHGMRELV